MAAKKPLKPCDNCKVELTTTKYCLECKVIVHRRQRKEAMRIKRANTVTLKAKRKYLTQTGEGMIDKKWLVRGTISTNNRESSISGQA